MLRRPLRFLFALLAAASVASGTGAAPAASTFTGTWTMEQIPPGGTPRQQGTITITQNGNALAGTMRVGDADVPLSNVSESSGIISFRVPVPGNPGVMLTYSGAVQGNQFGVASQDLGSGSYTVTGQRTRGAPPPQVAQAAPPLGRAPVAVPPPATKGAPAPRAPANPPSATLGAPAQEDYISRLLGQISPGAGPTVSLPPPTAPIAPETPNRPGAQRPPIVSSASPSEPRGQIRPDPQAQVTPPAAQTAKEAAAPPARRAAAPTPPPEPPPPPPGPNLEGTWSAEQTSPGSTGPIAATLSFTRDGNRIAGMLRTGGQEFPLFDVKQAGSDISFSVVIPGTPYETVVYRGTVTEERLELAGLGEKQGTYNLRATRQGASFPAPRAANDPATAQPAAPQIASAAPPRAATAAPPVPSPAPLLPSQPLPQVAVTPPAPAPQVPITPPPAPVTTPPPAPAPQVATATPPRAAPPSPPTPTPQAAPPPQAAITPPPAAAAPPAAPAPQVATATPPRAAPPSPPTPAPQAAITPPPAAAAPPPASAPQVATAPPRPAAALPAPAPQAALAPAPPPGLSKPTAEPSAELQGNWIAELTVAGSRSTIRAALSFDGAKASMRVGREDLPIFDLTQLGNDLGFTVVVPGTPYVSVRYSGIVADDLMQLTSLDEGKGSFTLQARRVDESALPAAGPVTAEPASLASPPPPPAPPAQAPPAAATRAQPPPPPPSRVQPPPRAPSPASALPIPQPASAAPSTPPGKLPLPALRDLPSNGLAATPLMGWSSRQKLGSRTDDAAIRQSVEGLVESGLNLVGYVYVEIGDGWQGARDAQGVLHPNERFPDMKALADYIHSEGLKFGLTASAAPKSCNGLEGSYGHEAQDARTFAEWDVDYVVFEWCGAEKIYSTQEEMRAAFQKMGEALRASGRDMVYGISQRGEFAVEQWASKTGANVWRSGNELDEYWASISAAGFGENGKEAAVKPGAWSDPGLLQAGNGMTADTSRMQINLWAVLAGPMMLGTDVRIMTRETVALLNNREIIGVNQDKLGRQGKRVVQSGDTQVWAKPLADGSVAVAFFNTGERTTSVAVTWEQLGIQGPHLARDLWWHENLGIANSRYVVVLTGGTSMLLKLSR